MNPSGFALMAVGVVLAFVAVIMTIFRRGRSSRVSRPTGAFFSGCVVGLFFGVLLGIAIATTNGLLFMRFK